MKKKKIGDNNIKIEDVINLTNICSKSYNFIRNQKNKKNNFDNNLDNFIFNKKNIINKIKVTLIRKKIKYTKDICIIMTDEMEENIKKNNSQYFLDTTYYATPPNSKQSKFVLLLAFNKAYYKALICNLSKI